MSDDNDFSKAVALSGIDAFAEVRFPTAEFTAMTQGCHSQTDR